MASYTLCIVLVILSVVCICLSLPEGKFFQKYDYGHELKGKGEHASHYDFVLEHGYGSGKGSNKGYGEGSGWAKGGGEAHTTIH